MYVTLNSNFLTVEDLRRALCGCILRISESKGSIAVRHTVVSVLQFTSKNTKNFIPNYFLNPKRSDHILKYFIFIQFMDKKQFF